MRKTIGLFLVLFLCVVVLGVGCTEETNTTPTGDTNTTPVVEEVVADQTTPEGVMEMVIKSAKEEDYSDLADLCDAELSVDLDVVAICDLTADTDAEVLDEYNEVFGNAEVVGDATIDGDTAEVDFTIESDPETMKMVKVEDKWYLYEF